MTEAEFYNLYTCIISKYINPTRDDLRRAMDLTDEVARRFEHHIKIHDDNVRFDVKDDTIKLWWKDGEENNATVVLFISMRMAKKLNDVLSGLFERKYRKKASFWQRVFCRKSINSNNNQ